jgi:LysR family hydrogen peroxide-inducible transcriptional activator
MGISLVPAMATRRGHAETPVYRSVSGKKPGRTVVAAWPKQRPPGRAASEFLNILRANVAAKPGK